MAIYQPKGTGILISNADELKRPGMQFAAKICTVRPSLDKSLGVIGI
jgi:hypothetical protein